MILKSELSQSNFVGSEYDDFLDDTGSASLCSPFMPDIAGLFSAIMVTYNSLSSFQRQALSKIFYEFDNIRKNIDPNRLKSYEHYFNADEELLMYRNTKEGLTNIIINPDDCIAFSFISTGSKKDIFYFISLDGDFEQLIYHFFSC